MKQDFIQLSSGDRYYIRMPEAFYGDEVEIHVFVPKKFAGKFIRIEPVDDPLRNKIVYIPENKRASEMDLAICHVFDFQHSEVDSIHTPTTRNAKEASDDTIPGHPRCHYGECWDCHVVSCPVYQGYEDLPEKPT